MKLAILEFPPELAAEAFAVLRDAGADVLGSLDAQPNLRIVLTHPDLPADCAQDDTKPIPVVRMQVAATETPGRLKLAAFTVNPWAAPHPRRAR